MNQQLPLGAPAVRADRDALVIGYEDPAQITAALGVAMVWLRARLREEGARPGRRVVVRVEFE